MKLSIFTVFLLLTGTTLAQNERVTMIETFTSSTCGPCAPGNVNLEGLLSDSQNSGKFVSLKYQMSWPGNGDPYFTDEGDTRRNFYSVNSVPHTRLDAGYGSNPGSLDQTDLEDYFAVAPKAELTAFYQLNEATQTVDVQVEVQSLATIGTGGRIFVAVFEYETYNNTGSNGETQFEHVMKKMMPGATGQFVLPMDSLEVEYREFSHTFQGSYVLPADATDPIDHNTEHSVEEFSDLGVAVWFQNVNTKEVYQAMYAQMGYHPLSVHENEEVIASAKIYPNPVNDVATIAFHMTEADDVVLEIVNGMGQVVSTEIVSNNIVGRNTHSFNTNELTSGMYTIRIGNENGKVNKRFTVK